MTQFIWYTVIKFKSLGLSIVWKISERLEESIRFHWSQNLIIFLNELYLIYSFCFYGLFVCLFYFRNKSHFRFFEFNINKKSLEKELNRKIILIKTIWARYKFSFWLKYAEIIVHFKTNCNWKYECI